MESERFDATGGNVEQHPLKQDTTLQMDLDECNSSADDTPPTMIIVETCISNKETGAVVKSMPLQATIKQQQAEQLQLEAVSAVETTAEQAGCSLTLGFKPNVQFNILPQSVAANANRDQLLSSTEAALAAATISYATDIFEASNNNNNSNNELGVAKLRRCVDGATQCNNLNLDYEQSSCDSMPSIDSLVCRICHNADNPEQLVSPCLCKGSLTYVHVHCLERWISTSRCTICELCQFHYNTEQTLRYTCLQSLRLWYSRAMSRRALQEDCQMFSLLTLVAFGIIGTLLVGIQYYAMHTQSWGLSKLWTKSWMVFFLIMTITVYFANVYMLVKSQLTPWYRWWQSARDIKLILENRRPFPNPNRVQPQYVNPLDTGSVTASMFTHHDHMDVRAASQRPYLTPSSSASSLPRNPTAAAAAAATAAAAAAVPAVPAQAMEMTALGCSANANESPKSKAEETKPKEAETEA